jgi:hypothetical protein
VACSSIPDETLCHKLTAFVFAADPKSQKKGSRGDRVFAPTNVDARTKLKGAERELRNTAVFATGGFLAKRHPRPPDPLVPSKLPTVRRAHTHAEPSERRFCGHANNLLRLGTRFEIVVARHDVDDSSRDQELTLTLYGFPSMGFHRGLNSRPIAASEPGRNRQRERRESPRLQGTDRPAVRRRTYKALSSC